MWIGWSIVSISSFFILSARILSNIYTIIFKHIKNQNSKLIRINHIMITAMLKFIRMIRKMSKNIQYKMYIIVKNMSHIRMKGFNCKNILIFFMSLHIHLFNLLTFLVEITLKFILFLSLNISIVMRSLFTMIIYFCEQIDNYFS